MKKIAALLLCAVLALAAVLPVCAEGTASFLYAGCTAEQDVVKLVGIPTPDNAVLTCTAGGEALTTVEYSTIGQENAAITYFCLVDPSTSLSNHQKAQQVEVMQAISDQLRPIDIMVIGNLGQSLTIGDPIIHKADRDAIINGKWPKSLSTYISGNMLELVKYFSDSDLDPAYVRIVVISDGIDDLGSSTQEAEALAAVASSGLTISTVALVDPYPTTYAKARTEYLHKFSDASLNGFRSTPTLDGMTAAEIAQAIVHNAVDSTVICIDGSRLDHSGSDVAVEITCAADGSTLRSTASIPADLIASIPEYVEETIPETEATEATEETEETTEETEEPTTEPTEELPFYLALLDKLPLPENLTLPEGINSTYILIAGIAASALLLLIIILLLVLRSKDDEEEDDDVEFMDKAYLPNPRENEIQLQDIVIPQEDLPAEALPEMPDFLAGEMPEAVNPHLSAAPAEDNQGSNYRVKLLVQPENTVALEMHLPVNRSKTIGRTQRADYVLNENDTALSGLHFVMAWDGSSLHVMDCGSTNGTIVDGLPLEPELWTAISTGSAIRAGSYEYLIFADKM